MRIEKTDDQLVNEGYRLVSFDDLSVGSYYYRQLDNSYYEKINPTYFDGELVNARNIHSGHGVFVYDGSRVWCK